MKYRIAIEETVNGYCAYSPDLPRRAAAGTSLEAAERNARQAVELHLEGLRAEGFEIARPTTRSSDVEIAA